MNNKEVFVSREELYAMVWATPMQRLAKEFGISDVALAKTCKKLGVPRPSRGYWPRKAAETDGEGHFPALQKRHAEERRLSI